MCLGCDLRAPQKTLVRFVLRDGLVVLDKNRRLSGRGAYCCKNTHCLASIQKQNKKLAWALRAQEIHWNRDKLLIQKLYASGQQEGTDSRE